MGRRIGGGIVLAGVAALAMGSVPAAAAPFREATICQGSVPDRHPGATISVDGNRLTFADATGAGQMLRGLNFRALITDHRRAYDQGNSAAQDAGFYRESYDADLRYGSDEIAAMKRWGANTVRFQVSQHNMEIEEPGYVRCLTNAVRTARNGGMLVVLAMQWQKNLQGDAFGHKLPTAVTRTAWAHVDALFRDDPGILYDLYNEPPAVTYADADKRTLSPNAGALWRAWLDGDGTGDAGYIGHQALIDWMRSPQGLGTDKVLMVEPLDLGRSYEGMPLKDGKPPLDDPAHRLVYAVHPYPKGRMGDTSAEQDALFTRRWGYLKALGVPVMVTEWAESGPKLAGLPVARGADLINYVNANDIPFVGSAFDVDGMFVEHLTLSPEAQPRQPTSYDAYDPPSRVKGTGPGMLVCRFFQRGYQSTFKYGAADLMRAPVPGESAESPCQVRAGR